jgi:hypothetical protein
VNVAKNQILLEEFVSIGFFQFLVQEIVLCKLMGHTKFTKVSRKKWHIRMDSFVHSGVWFEAGMDSNGKFMLTWDEVSHTYKLPGRLSGSSCSDLRIVLRGDRIRIDDMTNREVWAECVLPEKLQDDLQKEKTRNKRKHTN